MSSSTSSPSSSTLSLSPSIEANKTLANLMRCMHTIAPLCLADTSWDNVGLLLQAPYPRSSRAPGSSSTVADEGVHLCIDLTPSVLQEALQSPIPISTILCYHPIIFRGLKSLTMTDSQQATLLRCAAEGVSIYSPHTSLDATPGGINDWLAQGCKSSPEESFECDPEPCQKSKGGGTIPEGYQGAGMGRKFTLVKPVELTTLVQRIKKHLGIRHLQIATPKKSHNPSIRTIALCAGSGGSVLAGDDSDCWLTGEMSHHEILAANAAGRSVILTNHTNTERGYLSAVLQPRLQELSGGALQVTVSDVDCDPLRVA